MTYIGISSLAINLFSFEEEYKRKEFEGTAEDDKSMAGLKWTTAAFKKVCCL